MKILKSILLIVLVAFLAVSCSDEDTPDTNESMTIEGTFSRSFDVQGNAHSATYTISSDKITYNLAGLHTASYTIGKEFYSSKDNRWIGISENNNTFYVLFFKEVKDSEFTMYKKEVKSLEEGKTTAVPSADDTKNHGWNTYQKNAPISGTVKNLHAKQLTDYAVNPPTASGEFVKFSFKKGGIVTDDNWDIAFRATTIIVNGGESTGVKEEPKRTGEASIALALGTFSEITKAPESARFKQDEKGMLALPKSLWYTYNFSDHSINPVAGKVLVVKTIDGNYAKIEILSYYKDMDSSNSADPKNSGAQYYTFNYVYNPTVGDKNLQ
ncbi:hypothetical protein F7642_09515 [Tenacibaculum finnmarkense genomovar ulcerans]|uniref:HmuY family protein n=1 Tax=Tenacibaculum finnmarkense TaxID=2781243 RepID=UPI00187B1756|nr:HmuY family protein [Tenacibaculum finnmarkense]MBE7634564.1 hypothetical protein [Tenacibaculum finnmarkense genomovar ulcerans]MBE7688482.1 hypothetical protein [Tenacibaculum finnmarkense genomovar ulcerans]MCD8430367.1 HmuY family protein [Tenacibaculum finnmarkense genomovar ulcerans]MCG8859632.1 hypothetical protein [Tenacibaculum finnmarkense]